MRKALYALTIVGLLGFGVAAQQSGGAFLPDFAYNISSAWTFSGSPVFSGTPSFTGTTSVTGGTTLAGTNTISGNTTLSGINSVTGRLYVRESFDQGFFILQDDLTAKSVTDGEVNIVLGGAFGMISYREELTKTASSWVVASGTLDISADDTTDNEGVEIVFGGAGTNTVEGMIIAGTTGACLSASITIADISGTDQVMIGWRQNQTFTDAAAYAGYTVWNTVGVNNADGSIFSEQEVSETTDQDDSGVNWADGQTRILKSCISAAGVPTAYYTAASGTTFTAITMTETGSTLTATTKLWPFFSYLAAGTDGADVVINWVQLGPPE